MISELQKLAQKVDQTVALIQVMREENADLRRQLVDLTTINGDLTERIQQAHERVSIVLNKLPSTEQELE